VNSQVLFAAKCLNAHIPQCQLPHPTIPIRPTMVTIIVLPNPTIESITHPVSHVCLDLRNSFVVMKVCIIYTMQLGKNHLFLSFLLVNSTFASKLRGLEGYEIVLICDDSGSMNTELSELFFPSIYLTHRFLGDVSGPYNQSPTRCMDFH
jgi:hypothetical protein